MSATGTLLSSAAATATEEAVSQHGLIPKQQFHLHSPLTGTDSKLSVERSIHSCPKILIQTLPLRSPQLYSYLHFGRRTGQDFLSKTKTSFSHKYKKTSVDKKEN